MPKVNFIIEEAVQRELRKMVPIRQRSKLVNEAIKKELLLINRAAAFRALLHLRKKTARFSSREIDASLKAEREKSADRL